jgi:hypothetical protein
VRAFTDTAGCASIGRTCRTRRRLKARTWSITYSARSPAFKMARAAAFLRSDRSAISLEPRMAPSKLLKSCAGGRTTYCCPDGPHRLATVAGQGWLAGPSGPLGMPGNSARLRRHRQARGGLSGAGLQSRDCRVAHVVAAGDLSRRATAAGPRWTESGSLLASHKPG